MKKLNLVVAAGLACSLGAVALAEKPALSHIAPYGKVSPIRMAKVVKVDGKIQMVGDWIAYNDFGSRALTDSCLYDGFGRQWGATATGAPEEDGTSLCALGGSRWFFGNTYNNPLTEDDMPSHADGEVTENDFGWYWLGDQSGSTQCFVAVFVTDGDANTCVTATTGTGVIYDFGALATDPGGYYYSNVDLTGTGFMTLSSAETEFQLVLAEAFDGTTLTFTSTGRRVCASSQSRSAQLSPCTPHWANTPSATGADG